ncbi:hypothetical protein [Natrinema versiforme]|uniref:Uncharacterized protein n=2 Tax=root TaxID=1 RepID=A0A4P8WNN6_9EURY|nr:hypothetical protein [Natrinema versiforme]YP_010772688.1 large major capsid protein [Natrinema versiforme icosahedral virus 1]QCS45110.1 hypothetical protein FEJ81_22840 [Natrinema versiforme]DAC85271.1 TPA_asm: large major capsid protein [Natrinema versiforme icosahedral virus 1]
MAVEDQLQAVDWTPGSVTLREFNTQEGTPGEASVIAETQVGRALQLRDDPDSELRLVLPAYEHFTTDANADNTETFELANTLVESPTTQDLLIWEDGAVVQPDAVDYGADSFDYTSSGTETDLDVFYVARNPASVEIRKTAPGAGGKVNQTLKEAQTAILHTRDQAQQEIMFGFERTPLQPYLPRKFNLQVVVDAPYTVAFEAPERANGTPRARNALLSLPRYQTEARIEGLGAAVKQDMIGVRG